MDSSETRNDVIAPNLSDSAPVQDSTSTIFSYISDISPTKPSKGAVVAPSFPELGYPPQVFTSPGINPQSQSGSLKRPQYHHLSSEYSKQYDDKNDDIAPVICTSGKVNVDFSYQLNSHGIGHSINGSVHGKGGITSQYVDEFLADLLKLDSDDAENAANSSLKQSDIGTHFFKDFADCINYNSMNGEQHNVHVRTENVLAIQTVEFSSTSQQLQESTQTSQLHTCDGEPVGVISTEQNDLLHDSEASQHMFGVPRCCLQYDESQQDAVAKICGSSSQSNAASILRSSSSKTQVLESSSAAIYAPPNNLELENSYKPILSTFHTPKFGKSSLAVSKPLGIGLHLNSIVNALPMGCGATLKSADRDYMIVQGKKSFCTTDSHPSENAWNSPTSSQAVDGILKPSEHHSPAGDNGEYTKLSPKKKRKRSTGSGDGDGCKHCSCKKTKCLKLYCDCFASGYYCAQTCSCQGCFNTSEYEDTVLETRRQIVSRDPLAFAPKIFRRVGESPAKSIQDINKSTPSSARHKRGCNCKKSMCLKRYCECYQSNIGCSDGCGCAGCKNVYGKKEECGSSKHIANTEASNDIPEISPDQKLDTISHSELSIPHYMTSFTPFFRYTECGELPGADVALSATHERPSNSTKSSDNHKMIEETCQTIPDLLSSDLQLYDCNSKRVDDSTPHRCSSNSLSIHHDRRPVAVACITSQTTEVMTNDTSSQACPESVSFSLLSSRKLSSSPITSVVPLGEKKLPMVLDSDSRCCNILQDDDIPEILKEHSISYSGVKVRSPNKKRVSPPLSRFHELRPSSSITGLRSGRKYILKAVPSFPPLAPCINVKSTSSPTTDAPNSRNKND